MPFTQHAGKNSHWVRHVLLLGGLGLVFSLLGPFGTFTDLTAPTRFAYWYGLMLFGYLSILLCGQAFANWARGKPLAAILALMTLASAIPTTFAVAWVESISRLGRAIPMQSMPRVYASVAVVQFVMVLLLLDRWRRLKGGDDNPTEAVKEEPETTPAAFLQRIPPHLGADLLAVTSEDHYLRIHTSLGSDLILMRLGDAIGELSAVDGMQVHRSWWVARSAVREIRRGTGRLELVLANGVVVPVSRSSQAAVRAAHWPWLAAP